MKILVIIGSPRKKSSYQFAKLFEEEFKKKTAVEFNYIFLQDYNLKYCIGCSACKENEKSCPINDDIDKIKSAIKIHDGIIFACPVYENNITALMKNFFDRLHSLSFKPIESNKFSIIIGISAFSGLKFVLDYLYFMISNYGLKISGSIGILTLQFNNNTNYKNKIIKKINNIINRSLNAKIKFKPKLKDLIIFKDQKNRILITKDRYTSSYNYWKDHGWLDKNYFYDVKINPIKKIALKFMNLPLSRN